MPSQFQIPIRFKTLVTPASVVIVSLPFISQQLPLQVVQVKKPSAPVAVNAPAINVNSVPLAPTQPSAFQFISVSQYGGIGTYWQISILSTALPVPPLPLDIIKVLALGGVGTYWNPTVYPLALREPAKPPSGIFTSAYGGPAPVFNPPPIRINKLPLHEFFKDAYKYDLVYDRPAPLTPVPGLVTNIKRFNVTTNIAGTLLVIPHGLATKPQVVLMTIGGETSASGNSGALLSYKKGFGAATLYGGVITQFCYGTHSDSGVNPTQSDTTTRNDSICSVVAAGAVSPQVTAGRLAIQSIDSVNVTFIINEQFDGNYSLIAQFIGGTDLTSLSLFTDTAPAAIGTKSYTTPGFKPDFLLFFGGHLSQSYPDVENDSSTFIGAADKNLNQWVWSGGVNDDAGGATARAKSYCRAGECITILGSAVTPPDCRASLQSIDALGFTLDWTKITTTNGRKFICLAVQGANWSVGNFLSPTDFAVHQVVSGLSYRPIGEVLVSAGKPASTVDTLDANELLTISLNQDYSKLGTQVVGQKDVTAPTVTYRDIADSFSYENVNTANVPIGFGSIVSTQVDGFSFIMSTPDPVASFVGYITFGAIQTPTYSTRVVTVKPNGGGDYLSLQAAITGELLLHKNLISENIVLEIDCYAGIDVTPVTITSINRSDGKGFITDTNHYILIKAVNGHNGLFDSSGASYLLDVTGTVNGILIQNEYVRFQQLQIRMNVSSGTGGIAAYFCGSTNMLPNTDWRFINCLAQGNITNGAVCDGFKSPSAGTIMDDPGVSWVAINCVAYDFICQDLTMNGFNTANTTLQKIRHYNCGAYNCNQGFQDHSDVIQINNVAIGCDNGWNTSTGPNASSDYNFSTCGPPGLNGALYPGTITASVLDAKGPHSSNGLPVYIRDGLNGDYRPLPGDIAIIGTGRDLSADPFFPFNFDITGSIRTGLWTRGPFQVDSTLPLLQGVKWKWVGGVTDKQATINVKLNVAEANVFIKIGLLADLSDGVLIGSVATNVNNVASFVIGVAPSQKQYYQVYIAGTLYGTISSFTGLPISGKPASFVMAVGGCSDVGSNSNIFTAIKNKNPVLYLEYGDLHYWNITSNDPVLFRLGYDSVNQTPKRASLYDSVVRDYVWDDHDFGKNNTDGTNPAKVAAEATYRENVPSYTLPSVIGQIYHSFVIGRVRCIVTDLRSERSVNSAIDNSSKTMMGAAQLAWFFSELLAARDLSQFVLWFSTVPWIAPSADNNSDNWGGFTTERKKIADFIETNQLSSIMMMFTGDMHSAAIDDGTHNVYTTSGLGNHVPVVNPFPLNQTSQIYGGVYTQGPVTHIGTRLMGFAGIITITDDGHTFKIQNDIINELGTVLTFTKTYQYPYSPFIVEHPGGTTYTSESAPASSVYTIEKPASTSYSAETPSATQFTIEKPSDTGYTGE